jgi:general stress protein YciG
MCRPNERTHKHHIIPRYMGGVDTPENIVEVTVTQHAMFHFCNYQLWSNQEDIIAWRALSGLITADEVALEAQSLGAKKGGNKCKENKTGVFGLSPEERIENSRKAGNKTKENKTGIFGLSTEELSKAGKKGGKIAGNKCKENKTGVCGQSLEKMRENGRKGGKISGNKSKENKTGVYGLPPEKLSEAGKKGGKTLSSQKWQCTETGYVSTAGGLSSYQKARGIDTSKRIKLDGPRSWEITFEDGRVVVITISLKTWTEENGYSYRYILKVRAGKSPNYRGIIKVVPL